VKALLLTMLTAAGPALAADADDLRRVEETRRCVDCDLSGADFFGQDLSRAVLSGSDLSGADFTGAILYFAILQGADLSDAQFADANLYGADLRDADLSGAETGAARICHTVLPSGQRSYGQCAGTSGGF
jgi:uncharacterized protein YjbI with pentapeptide repeats